MLLHIAIKAEGVLVVPHKVSVLKSSNKTRVKC